MEVAFLPSSMFVYPAPRVSPQGRGNYVYMRSDGTTIPAGRTFSRRAEKRYCFPLSRDGMKLDTGLNELVDNPFANEEFALKYIKDQWAGRKEELQSKDQITLQTYLEVLHNRPPGTYTDEKMVRKGMDGSAKENTFFESYSVPLKDGTNVFTSDSIDHQLAMLLVKANPSIAPSKNECNPAIHDFYIGAANEAAVETQNKRRIQGKAIARLNNIYENYSDFVVFQLAIVLEVVKGPVNAVMTRNALDDFLWKQDKNMMPNINKFNRLTDRIDSKEGMEKLYLRYILQSALNTNTISIINGNFIWGAKKNVKNLYNLGTKEDMVLTMFYTEMMNYDPELEVENFYGDLITELRYKGVKVMEDETLPKQKEEVKFDEPVKKKPGRPKGS